MLYRFVWHHKISYYMFSQHCIFYVSIIIFWNSLFSLHKNNEQCISGEVIASCKNHKHTLTSGYNSHMQFSTHTYN
jgi:hypothetical protein